MQSKIITKLRTIIYFQGQFCLLTFKRFKQKQYIMHQYTSKIIRHIYYIFHATNK